MVGAAGIVARTLTGILSEEYRARIDHSLCQLLVVERLDDKVLRGIGIRKGYHLVNGIDEYQTAVVECLAGYLLTGQ